MKIETIEVAGFQPAFEAMRNPMNSHDRSDSHFHVPKLDDEEYVDVLGDADVLLSYKLQTAGPEHCKHLRMIMAWADITAPRYWWQEADTYRIGVEKVSCSTMHKLMSRKLTEDDFEPTSEGLAKYRDASPNRDNDFLLQTIDRINYLIGKYNEEADPSVKRYYWEQVIQLLPQSYLQKRTVMFSYAALRNIVRQREGHKLGQWKVFIDWVRTLPYATQLIFDGEPGDR